MKNFEYLLISLVLLLAANLNAEELSYLNENGELTNLTDASTSVTSDLTSWNDGWYVVDESVTISNRIQVSGTVNLILKNGVTLTAEKGITVGSDASFNVYAQSDKESEMGALNATGEDYAAGIGGGKNGVSGTISINGGTVTATGGYSAAGIGGGKNGAGGTITINGGTVTATGGSYGAGIGGGYNNASGRITINGGTITINGGTINAMCGNLAAGIGGGNKSSGEIININGGAITATCGNGGSGIGGGSGGSGGTINIDGGIVTATGGRDGAGIGGGRNGAGGTISINGGKVTANGGSKSVGVGRGVNGSASGSVTLGWTNEDDFIYASNYGNVETIKFADGKLFYYEESGKGVIVESTDKIGGKTLRPCNEKKLEYAIISGVQPYYLYTGDEIDLTYKVTYFMGKELVKETDYTASFTPSPIKDVGDYTLTIAATNDGVYTGSKSVSFSVAKQSLENSTISGIQTAYLYTGNEIELSYKVTDVEGKELVEGVDYTASLNGTPVKGVFFVKVAGDYTLTITAKEDGFYTGSKSVSFSIAKRSLENSIISGIQTVYLYTGNKIELLYKVTDVEGKELVEGTDYTATFTPSPVKDAGNYTLTIAAKEDGFYTGSKTISFTVSDGIPVTATTTELTNGIYCVSSDVTVDERIVITGDVTLLLGEGKTLTASNGIEVLSGNKLTIDGMGSLNASGKEATAGIGGGDGGSGGTITINGGNVTARGGDDAAGIGGGDQGVGGIITINGGTVTATGGYRGAGIGGGHWGAGGTITINGGKVKANAGSYSVGIGSGNGAPESGSVTLGWTYEDDFIYASSYGVGTIKFADGKTFYYEDNGRNVIVKSTYNIGGKTLRSYYGKNNLKYATVSEIQSYYLYTGNEINLTYKVTDFVGKELLAGTDYKETFIPSPVKDKGEYTLVIAAKDDGAYTGSIIVNFSVVLSGSGSEADPYIISNEKDWDYFAASVNEGETYSGKFIKLEADISVSTKVGVRNGSQDRGFSGVFDGGGHTITADITDKKNSGTALFGYISGATIKNLTLAGKITGGIHAAGIAGYSAGTGNRIDSCVVSATVDGGSHIGGILGHGLDSDIDIDYCVFKGILVGGKTAKGVLFGWGDNGGTKRVTNSLYIQQEGQNTRNLDLAKMDAGSVTVEDCYKTANVGTYGKLVYLEAPANEILIERTASDGQKFYTDATSISGVNPYYLYTGEEIALPYKVTDVEGNNLVEGTDYTATFTPSPVKDAGDYTLTITAKDDGAYTGSKTVNFSVVLGGNGSEAIPYIISNEKDWDGFAYLVSQGNSFAGKFIKLSADISVSTKVGVRNGSQDRAFSGVFDGGGHTITADITDKKNSGTALFGYISGATIKNLTLAGKITGGIHAAGIVGYSAGTGNRIDSCVVSATVDGGSHIGGILGHGLDSDIDIDNCVFKGKLVGGETAKGVLFGWGDNGGTKRVTNCLYIQQEGQDTRYLDLVNKHAGFVNVKDCYKTANVGTYGTLVYLEAPTNEILIERTASDGQKFYIVAVSISGVNPYYPYTGEEINLTYKVTDFEGKVLVEGTDYTATFTSLPIKNKGDYTLTITAKKNKAYTGSKAINISVLDYIPVTASTFTMDGSYGLLYKVDKDVSVSERINVIGDVTLILDKGKTLTASKGIEVLNENKLTIEGMGLLNATGEDYTAGIGSGYQGKGGTIIINGGTVTATGGLNGSGIGGGSEGGAGVTISINGGTVTATGGLNGSGIGGGKQAGKGVTIIINGGTVAATGGLNGAGIGSGMGGGGGTIIINGGTVAATGGSNGAGIGGGAGGLAGTITINGGKVTANAGSSAVGVGCPSYVSSVSGGSVTLGWTNKDDFIYASSYGNVESIKFADGKLFYYEENGIITAVEGTDNIGGKTLRPIYEKNSLKYAFVREVQPSYYYTGEEIALMYKVTDVEGKELVKESDYTATFTPSSVKDVGDYTLTITAKDDGIYTDSKTVSFSVVKFDLENAVVSGVNPYYLYTGEEKKLTYKVTDYEGKELVEGTDYIASLNNSPINNELSVKDKGEYALTITAKENGFYMGKKTIRITVGDGIPVTATTTEMTNGIYKVSSDVTISERIVIKGDVTLILDEGKTLTASKGINVSSGNKLTIEGMGSLNATGERYTAGIGGGSNEAGGTICINGGTVTATGGSYSAGIGGGQYGSGGTISINGGIVTAMSDYGAGLGGGYNGAGGTITINGGTVTAKGDRYGAGIGGGYNGAGGTIAINGGKVTANAGSNSVGVGPGYGAPASGSVTLSWTNEDDFIYASSYGVETIKFADGKLFYYEESGKGEIVESSDNIGDKTLRPFDGNKNSLKYAIVSGVKPYYLYTGEEIALTYKVTDIEGKELVEGTDYIASLNNSPINNELSVKDKGEYALTITAKENGIYTGKKTICITVGDGIPVTATTTNMTNGIYRVSNDVTIDKRIVITGDVTLILDEGKTLTASKGINVSSVNELTIEGMGSLNATGEYLAAGVGSGSPRGAGGAITINGGTVTAQGGYDAAGIGGGSGGSGGTITINGGTVTAQGGYDAAGIGGGSGGSGGTITINGGTVTATGSSGGAGIGGGSKGTGGTISITGGTVTATGGDLGAGIGDGYSGIGGTVTINGGTVTATGSEGAGIGGGDGGSGGTITINGGIVTAISDWGAGIGSGIIASSATAIINISEGVKKIVASSSHAMCIGKGYRAEGSVVVNFISNGNIVTDAAKDAIFYDSGEGKERQIRTKNLNHVVSLGDDVKEYISVYAPYAVVGESVTLTLDGAVGASSLKVNDGSSDLALTDAGNGKWTFVMPESDVTVSARIVPTYSVTLPEQMVLHSTSIVADKFGKYQSGTVVSFRARSFWTASNVSDGKNVLTPKDGIYSVTVGDANIVIDAEFIRNSNVDLADIDDGFIAVDGDIMTGTTGYTVQISDGAGVTLNDATFNGGIRCLGGATITLVGSNKTQGFDGYAGIWVGTLGSTLTIKGEGSLEATGGMNAAGIGCSFVANMVGNLFIVNCGNVVIEGGNITARGGRNAAGIGMNAVTTESDVYYRVGDITIKGGTINAIAGYSWSSGSGVAGIGVGNVPNVILNSEEKRIFVGKISIYDDIAKVDASSISETVTYMHGETDVSANKDAYFNIVVDGKKQSITPKSEPDYAIAIDKNMMGGMVICRNTARAGDKVVLNPVPARGYTFNSLSVKDEQGHEILGNNGSSTGDYVLIISVAGDEETEKEYSFVMPARDVIVSAEFVPTYEIVFDEGIKNGSVTADVVAPEPGDVVTLTAFPDEGYALAAFSVKDGQGKTVKVNDNTFVMPASKVIVSAVFSPTYNIAIDGNMENGSVTANKAAAMAGEKVTLTATAASGYSLAYFTVKDDAGNDVEVTFDSFKMPEGPVTVSAVFVEGHVVYLDTLSRGYWAKDGDILKGTARCDGGVSHTVRIRSSGLRDTTMVTLWNVSLCGNIVAEGNAAIVLKGSNSVNAEQTNSAAIAIALDRKEFTLVIRGEGSLEAIGSTSNPGIGLESRFGNIEGGNLVIESGTITAKGGYGAAGIGTGIVRSRATLGDISIKGGAVTAIANNGYSNSSIQGIGIGEIESGTAQMGKIYLYHGLKVVNAYIKDMMQRYVVYMNGDGSEISGNVEEYFAYEGIGYDFFTKVRSLFNVGIDNNIANGTIAATVASSNGKAYADEVVTLTATPEFGYKVDFYTVKDAAGNNIEVNGNSFVMPLGDVTVSAKFVSKYAAITFTEDGKKATIDGAYGGTDAVEIDEDITVDNVVFNREFLKNTYSTMVLPFSVKTENVSGLNAVLYYNGIGKDANKNDAIRMKVLWATREWSEANDIPNADGKCCKVYGDSNLTANTPYLVQMGGTTLKVNGPVTIVPTADAVTKYDEWEWEFRGVWKYKKWDTGDRELGYAYGFAASAPENSKIKVGDFVKIGEGTYIYPLRAYLVSSNIPEPVQGVRANGAYAKRPTVAQKELPELMSVIVDDEGDGKQTTVIGHFNTRTGEFKMNNDATKRTFDVKGRNVGDKVNKARGAYYGKKVLK